MPTSQEILGTRLTPPGGARPPRRAKMAIRVRFLAVFALVALVIAAAVVLHAGWLAPEEVTAGVVNALMSKSVLAAVMTSSMLMILAALTPFPAEAVAIANGAYFGAALGLFVTWTSGLAGASIGFALSRRLGARVWSGAHRQNVEEAAAWLGRNGGRLLLAARLIPLIPFFVVNFGAGLTPLTWRTYLLVSAIGVLPFSTLLVLSGAGVRVLAGL